MKKYIYYGLLIVAVIVAIVLIQNNSSTNIVETGTYTEFAQCLGAKGALFYGAYWCPHCLDQKEMFGDAKNDLPYIECSLPGNQNSVTQECKDAGIEGYPTWIFADSSRASGLQTFEFLAEKTGCTLPGNDTQIHVNETIQDATVEAVTNEETSSQVTE